MHKISQIDSRNGSKNHCNHPLESEKRRKTSLKLKEKDFSQEVAMVILQREFSFTHITCLFQLWSRLKSQLRITICMWNTIVKYHMEKSTKLSYYLDILKWFEAAYDLWSDF